jgi:hypothetical protein
MASIHFIRIPDREARKQAIKAFMGVRENWVCFPGNLYGLTTEHVQALERDQVPFERIPKVARADGNGKNT